MNTAERFPYYFEASAPIGAEDWRSMYPYYFSLQKDSEFARDSFANLFWHRQALLAPDVLYPMDSLILLANGWAIAAYGNRVFALPNARGLSVRLLNGYLYSAPLSVTEADQIQQRAKIFVQRSEHYYENWDRISAEWKTVVEGLIKGIEKIEFKELPDYEPDDFVYSHGHTTEISFDLFENCLKLITDVFRLGLKHFEMIVLGYAAYLKFYQFCKEKFPEISDQQISQMISDSEGIPPKPEMELRRLAKLAIELGLSEVFVKRLGYQSTVTELAKVESGKKWLAELDTSKHPWFYYSTGQGYSHASKSWIDDMNVPFSLISNHVIALLNGEKLETSLDLGEKQEDLTNRYVSRLKTPDEIKAFEDKMSLARKVYPILAEQNLYLEHWGHTMINRKIKELGRLFANSGILSAEEDIFYVGPFEVQELILDLITSWAQGVPAMGSRYWPREIERRKNIIETLRNYHPPFALGEPPKQITDPITTIAFGVTTEMVNLWLGKGEKVIGHIRGIPASPGKVDGIARLVFSSQDIGNVKQGEILVAPSTAPGWNPVFGLAKGVITDTGGMMSHVAIICREQGLPAIVGTGRATSTIKDGQKIRMDGGTGIVEIME